MLRSLLFLPLLLLGVAPLAAQDLPPDQAAIKAHVAFLASDAMRGREAGTHDYDVAAEYMASEMLAAGLKPGGDKGGWFQPFQLTTYQPADKGTMTLTRGAASIPMQFGVDFINQPVPSSPEFSVSGPVVFVGYGIVDPENGRDDYKGLDVRGKVVAMLAGVPKGLSSDVQAHFDDDDQKATLAQARGAKAVVVIETVARSAEFPFQALAPYYDYPRNGWATPDGKAHAVSPDAPVVAYLSFAGAEKLFAGGRLAWSAVLAAEKAGTRVPTGALPLTLAATTVTRIRTVETRNVVGLLEGSDPTLKAQAVVLSAHLDHVGIGEAVEGDKIYNGAMDNAVGNAAILEVARAFQASGKRPRRSILFVSLSAEEKGLIGSDYFAHDPTPAGLALVADLNLDMPILTYTLKDLVVLGGERSSLGPTVAKAAAAEGLAVVPDPDPQEMFFVRSDHYSFVRAGIPAVSVDTGPGGEGAAATKVFLDQHYHKPSDDLALPWRWDEAARFVRINYAVARSLADADQRPSWNKGDFFGTLFNGYGAR